MRIFPILVISALQTLNCMGATPYIDTVSPPSANVGAGPLLITIHGANFAAGATVQVDGQGFTPTLLSTGRLTITLPASALATAHTAAIAVTNPGSPANAVSNIALFPVAHPSSAIATTQTFFPFNEPRGLVVADFNLDGNADVAVTSWCTQMESVCSPGKVNLLPGNGAGSFAAAISSDVCPTIGALATGDFNHDGKPDIAALCEDGVQILTGDGTGHFQASAVLPVLASPGLVQILSAIVVVDINGDGNPDLLVSGSPGVGLLIGDGAGHFAPVSIICAACIEANSLAVGDFNNDGKPDIATVNYYDPNVTVMLGDGAGGFTMRKVPTGFDSYALAAADVNGDGNTDLVVGTGSIPTDSSAVLLGDGTGAFTIGARLATGTVRTIVAADLNGDGRIDLAFTTDHMSPIYALADSAGGFTLSSHNLFSFGGAIGLGDFNNDGQLDFAAVGPDDSRLAILIQTPAASTVPGYTSTDICLPLSCYAWLLSDNGVAAGHNFAVYPGTGVLDFLQRTGQTFEPYAINKAGVIAGSAGFRQDQSPDMGFAAVWSPQLAEVLNLDPVFGWTHGIATSINDIGLIVGYSPGGPPVTGIVPGLSFNTVALITDNLGVLGTDNSGPLFYNRGFPGPQGVTRLPVASVFNSAGQVLLSAPQVGSLFTPGSGISSQPPAPGFSVVAFNTAGQFIGQLLPGGTPALYTAASGVTPLNSLLPGDSGWRINAVNAINNNGQILASATNGARNTTVLLTPVAGSSSALGAAVVQRRQEQRGNGRWAAVCPSLTFNMRSVCGAAQVAGF